MEHPKARVELDHGKIAVKLERDGKFVGFYQWDWAEASEIYRALDLWMASRARESRS
jgi:hypothetical protein